MESIRERLNALLSGSLLLDDFEDWLVSSSWNSLRDVDLELRQFVGAVELRLAEYSSGHLDERDLLDEFHALLVYGCVRPVIHTMFVSIDQPTVVNLTLSNTPDQVEHRFRLIGPASSNTSTGSGRTIVKERVRLAS